MKQQDSNLFPKKEEAEKMKNFPEISKHEIKL